MNAFGRCFCMKKSKQIPGYEDPIILASETHCKWKLYKAMHWINLNPHLKYLVLKVFTVTSCTCINVKCQKGFKSSIFLAYSSNSMVSPLNARMPLSVVAAVYEVCMLDISASARALMCQKSQINLNFTRFLQSDVDRSVFLTYLNQMCIWFLGSYCEWSRGFVWSVQKVKQLNNWRWPYSQGISISLCICD